MLLELALKRPKRLPKFPWPLQLSLAYLAAAKGKGKQADSFNAVETYCTFIGYSRSGHSLIAALLDAHPNIVMAHEMKAAKYVQYGFDREALYYLLYQRTKIRGHSWQRGGGYTYHVPNQWQGDFEEIKVIGDKHGEFNACYLSSNTKALDRLRKVVQVPIKLVHVVRNPFDNIATFSIKAAARRQHSDVTTSDIENSIQRYFRVCKSVMNVKSLVDTADDLDFRHEDLITSPDDELRALCLWLGVEASPTYLSDCQAVVFPSPQKRRHKIQWPNGLKQRIQNEMQPFPFLEGYTFEN